MATAKARWGVLHSKRSGVLTRARQASAITIPSIMPPEGHDEQSELKTPWQSLGARGVNNLASKMLLALLPSVTTFFRFRMDDDVVEQTGSDKTEVEDAMRELENKGMRRLEKGNLRTIAHMALKVMIVTGNALMHMPKTGDNRMFKLDKFCVVRNPAGRVVEIVVKELVHKDTLDPAIAAAVGVEIKDDSTAEDNGKIDLFTHVKLVGEKHIYYQEINEVQVPGSEGRVDAKESPWIVMRWSSIENEDYGRGLIEEYLGDMISLEAINKAIIQYAAAAARIILMLNPNSTTDEDELEEAESGDVITGIDGDINILQIDKGNDFQAAKNVMDGIELRLSHAFLLRSGTTRDAERVTAEEIRSQAQELEDVLGGVYTVQAHEFQLPIVLRTVSLMKESGDYPKFPKVNGEEVVTPSIVTGFEALGRGHELNRLRGFFQDLRETFGDVVLSRFKDIPAIKQFAVAHNVDVKDILKTEEDLAADAEAEQQAQLVDKTAGPIAGNLSKSAAENLAE